jgi:hypothetical protein
MLFLERKPKSATCKSTEWPAYSPFFAKLFIKVRNIITKFAKRVNKYLGKVYIIVFRLYAKIP